MCHVTKVRKKCDDFCANAPSFRLFCCETIKSFASKESNLMSQFKRGIGSKSQPNCFGKPQSQHCDEHSMTVSTHSLLTAYLRIVWITARIIHTSKKRAGACVRYVKPFESHIGKQMQGKTKS